MHIKANTLNSFVPDEDEMLHIKNCQEHDKSCKPHPSQRNEGSGHAATIELLPWKKVAVTNEICALRCME